MAQSHNHIRLGVTYTDRYLNITGIATQHVRYLGGSDRVMLEYKSQSGEKFEHWVEAGRLDREKDESLQQGPSH